MDDSLPDAEWLFARHLSAVGGEEAIRSIYNYEITGKLTIDNDESCTFVEFGAEPWLSQFDIRCEDRSIKGGFDGELAWRDHGRGPVPYHDIPVKTEQYDSDIHGDINFRSRYAQMRTVENVERQGRRVYLVETVEEEGAIAQHFFDAETGFRIERQDSYPNRDGLVHRRIRYDRYEAFDNIAMATTVTNEFLTVASSGTPADWNDAKKSVNVIQIEAVRFNLAAMPDLNTPESAREMDSERTISGVVELDGQAQPDAIVSLKVDGFPHGSPLKADASGRFRFTGVRGSQYEITARRDMHTGSAVGVLLPRAEIADLVVELRIYAGVRGTVRDPEGNPVANVFVESSQTNLKGEYEWTFQPDADPTTTHTLVVRHQGHRTYCAVVKVAAGQWTQHDIILQRAISLKGKLVDERGFPVADVRMGLKMVDGRDSIDAIPTEHNECQYHERFNHSVRSSQDGTFEFQVDHPGQGSLHAYHRGTQEAIAVRLPAVDVVYVLSGNARVEGTLMDVTGRPLEGQVWLRETREADGEDRFAVYLARKMAGKAGDFAFDEVPAGTYELAASATDPLSGISTSVKQTVEVVAGATIRTALRARFNPLSISGTVMRDGAPAAGVLVGVGSGEARNARTDGAGRFTLFVSASRLYNVGVLDNPTDETSPSSVVTAKAGDTGVVLVLRDTVTVSGRVIDERGKPVKSYELTGIVDEFIGDDAGIFQTRIEQREETRTLSIEANGYVDRAVTIHCSPGRKRIDLGDIVMETAEADEPTLDIEGTVE